MEKKRIYPEQTPPQNIPYASANKKLPFSYIVPEDESIVIKQDANGVLYLSCALPTPVEKVATPVITIVDESTVVAECETEGATIYYTNDGTMPSVASIPYTGSITNAQGHVYRFVAIKNGMVNSDEATVTVRYKNLFGFTAVSNSATIQIVSDISPAPALEASYDGLHFDAISINKGESEVLNLKEGETVYIKASGINTLSDGDKYTCFRTGYGEKVACTGNVMWLIDPSGSSLTVGSYEFYQLFYQCNITTAPQLPAMNLGDNCYEGMFSDCPYLTEAPDLPAMNLAYDCYCNMFQGDISLTKSPVLPATLLPENSYCYSGMFNNCTALAEVTCYAIDGTDSMNLDLWLSNVSPSGVFKKSSKAKGFEDGASGIPTGWTVIDLD